MPSEANPTRERRDVLISGRRFRVLDLVEADWLNVGDTLYFERPNIGDKFTSEITVEGFLRIPEGRVFNTPSAAASFLIGGRPVAGWNAWKTENGESLDEIRRRFLKDASVDLDEGDQEGNEGAGSPPVGFLGAARDKADTRPIKLTVQKFLSYWNTSTRDPASIARIDSDLSNYSLRSSPHFSRLQMTDYIQLVRNDSRNRDGAVVDLRDGQASVVDDPSVAGDGDSQDPSESQNVGLAAGLTLAQLLAHDHDFVPINKNEKIRRAITRMQLDELSHLGVTNNEGVLVGVVTWMTIALALAKGVRLDDPVDLVKSDQFERVRHDKELVHAIEFLQRREVIVVLDSDGRPIGIVTASDVVEAYQQLAAPFYWIGELDKLLREVLRDVVDDNEIYTISGAKSFDEMSFGNYRRAFSSEHVWGQLNWHFSREDFIDRLEVLRKARNHAMHFNPDNDPNEHVDKLRQMVQSLRSAWLPG